MFKDSFKKEVIMWKMLNERIKPKERWLKSALLEKFKPVEFKFLILIKWEKRRGKFWSKYRKLKYFEWILE